MAKNDKFEVTIGAVVINPKLGVLTLKRSENKEFPPGFWEIQGGHLEHGEAIEECLKRELLEETGLQIEIIKPINAYTYKIGDREHIEVVYLCTTEGSDIKLSDEHSDFRWFKKEEEVPEDSSIHIKKNFKLALDYYRSTISEIKS